MSVSPLTASCSLCFESFYRIVLLLFSFLQIYFFFRQKDSCTSLASERQREPSRHRTEIRATRRCSSRLHLCVHFLISLMSKSSSLRAADLSTFRAPSIFGLVSLDQLILCMRTPMPRPFTDTVDEFPEIWTKSEASASYEAVSSSIQRKRCVGKDQHLRTGITASPARNLLESIFWAKLGFGRARRRS